MTFLDRTIIATLTLLADCPIPVEPSAHAASIGDGGHPELAALLSVLFLMIDTPSSIVVNVASAHRGAGASTVARKLAEAAAASGWCRVALLDARPEVSQLGLGLVEAIERGESPVLVPQRVGQLNIDSGQLSTGGRPLTRVESVRKLYGMLRDRYSLIVVDCPAVLTGQQTLTVAAAADETVLVVEAERTALTDVARARDALERRGAGVLGIVMNKSRSRVPALFGRVA